MYYVIDDHGTRQFCWSRLQAMQWLPFCSDRAAIVSALTGRVVAGRNVQRVPQSPAPNPHHAPKGTV